MPIYEYECKHCQHTFDVLQKVQDEPVKECPDCHKDTAVRLVSAAGFQLKGTGWYATDFKDKGKASTTQPKAAESSSATNTSKGETK